MRAATFLCCALFALHSPARADTLVADATGRPSPPVSETTASAETGTFDFMHLLAKHGLHDLDHERWNAYGQVTLIGDWKPPFHADYTNLNGSTNSLLPKSEVSYTLTTTLYTGVRLWHGAEIYFVPEIVSELPFSNLAGLGGSIQNTELQKQASEKPVVYIPRLFLRQTFGFGGGKTARASGPMQLGAEVDRRRLVITIGRFSVLDFFDRNSVAGDPRQGLSNMAFMTYASFDFAADARGYTFGAVAELYYDDWAIRFARVAGPQLPNQLFMNFNIWEFYGDQLEIEHAHRLFGRDGTIRLLGYRNRENMGRFDDAIAVFQGDPQKNATTCPGFNYGSKNATAPDLCWVRKPNVKMGIGLSLEQQIWRDIGLFVRGMYSDGQTEVYSYTSTDSSLSVGALSTGSLWHRPADAVGVGVALGWISAIHARYLGLGGIDGFIGDGRIRQAPEGVVEAFYRVNLYSSLWASVDYQLIFDPAYNADRGPVNVVGARLHGEF